MPGMVVIHFVTPGLYPDLPVQPAEFNPSAACEYLPFPWRPAEPTTPAPRWGKEGEGLRCCCCSMKENNLWEQCGMKLSAQIAFTEI